MARPFKTPEETNEDKFFGSCLEQWRQESGFSREEVHVITGLPMTSLRRWEAGVRINAEAKRKLLHLYGVKHIPLFGAPVHEISEARDADSAPAFYLVTNRKRLPDLKWVAEAERALAEVNAKWRESLGGQRKPKLVPVPTSKQKQQQR